MRLIDKVIIVTGAGGISSAAARAFSSEGASVFVISIDPDECARAVSGLDDAGWSDADLTDEQATARAFGEARRRYPRIDGLFGAAGGSGRRFGDGPLHEIPYSGWLATLDLNLTTSYLAAREAILGMLEQGSGGSVVLLSSVLAEHPAPQHFATHAYAAAKGAQISLTRAMASYYAPHGIRVNAITPGLTATPMSERALSDPAVTEFMSQKQTLSTGPVTPDQVAEAAVFLLADGSSAVTGQVIAVDGGWSVSSG